MYLLILYFPLVSFLIIGLFGRFLGTNGCNIVATLNMFLNFLLSFFIFYEVVLGGSICFFKLFSWFNVGNFSVDWGFFFDPITSVMLIVVNVVSFFVHLYSIDYMKHDFFSHRFMSYLSLFTWFMLILVTADNFLQLFVGWEGVGLVSYLLINFWFTIVEANKSALKAMIMNRIGDIGIALGVSLIFFEFKTLDFNVIFPIAHLFSEDFFFIFNSYIHLLTLVAFLFLLGAIGKSAQFGLHTWLPDAMAGPTPVSALIHAATMVTAGVFVLIRISPILEQTTLGLQVIAFVGIFTAFFASSIGLFQNDIKKIIAYSTCSQLGYMVFACGLSNYSLSLFHLTNHAFFKALLFLSAGAVIHGMLDEQDMRKYGGLHKILPFSYICIFIGSLSLMGIPFLTGFYSKDLIIESSFCSYFFSSNFFYWLSVLSAFFTSVYSTRLIYYTFWTKPNGFKNTYSSSHDSPIFMFIPLFCLSFFSIFFGFFFKDLFVGLGNDTWLTSLSFSSNKNLLFLESEFLIFLIKNIPFFFSILGVLFVCIFFFFFDKVFLNTFFKNKNLIPFYSFFTYKWYIDCIYNKVFVNFFFNISYSYVKNIDRGVLELIGPLGSVRFLNFVMKFIKNLQTGFLYNYIFIFILSITCIFLFFFFNFFFFDLEYFFLFICLFFLKKI
jgi:NADH-ubiquinone oxidoreductase chain 5